MVSISLLLVLFGTAVGGLIRDWPPKPLVYSTSYTSIKNMDWFLMCAGLEARKVFRTARRDIISVGFGTKDDKAELFYSAGLSNRTVQFDLGKEFEETFFSGKISKTTVSHIEGSKYHYHMIQNLANRTKVITTSFHLSDDITDMTVQGECKESAGERGLIIEAKFHLVS